MTAGKGSLPAKRKPHPAKAQTPTKIRYLALPTAHYTTMLTSLPGTTITLRIAEAPMNF
jgi:hypothetical protein